MAVARPQAGGGSTGLKVALVVFVCLTLASLTFMIILYTHQEDLKATTTAANDSAQRARQDKAETLQQMGDFAKQITGQATEDVPKIKQQIQNALQPVLEDESLTKKITPEAALLTTLDGLYKVYAQQTEELKKMTAERDDLSKQLSALTASIKETEDKYTADTERFEQRIQDLEQAGNTNRDAWQADVQRLTDELASASEKANQQLGSQRELAKTLQAKVEGQQERIDELVTTLASFRPAANQLSVLEVADGNVIRAVAGQDIVYINLGRRDGINPGMTFAVYSKVRGIPSDGKGKATLMVANVFETTAECRVTSTTTGDPILEKDIIANPVYDRSRKFNFVVAGDFDLDFNGQAEDTGGLQVADLIKGWGGNVVNTVDTRTDFVVLGEAPRGSIAAGGNAESEAKDRAAKRQDIRNQFEQILSEAKALSIPILTRTQFLHFVGLGVPKNVPDDNLAAR